MAFEKASKVVANIISEWEKRGALGEEEQEPNETVVQSILQGKYRILFGPRFITKTFDNYEIYGSKAQANKMKVYLEISKRYAIKVHEVYKKGYSLAFVGNSGTGKNHLVYSIAREILKAGYELEIKTFLEIAREIKSSWDHTSAENESSIINKYAFVDFLILEEIGVQYNSTSEKVFLFEILDKRYKYCKPYILTSNLSEKEFREYIDFDGHDRIWDRLHETGKILYFDWTSYRQRREEQRTN